MPKARLVRKLTFTSLFLIVVADMIGVGIFTTSGFIIRDSGSPALLLAAWAIGGVFALCGALCYGELGALFPRAGGDYVFLREGFGPRTAFLSGWVSLIVGFSAPIAAVATAICFYFSEALGFDGSGFPVRLVAAGLIGLVTLVHCGGLRFGTHVHNALTALKLLVIFSMIGGGLLWGKGSFDHFSQTAPVSEPLAPSLAVSLIFITFAYTGWNASAYVGGEVKRPAKDIPRSIIAGVLFVTGLYLLLNVVFVYASPPLQMAGVREIGHLSAVNLFGEGSGRFYSLLIAVSLVSSLSAMMLIGPRVYYAMAQDGAFFRWFAQVDAKHLIPAKAIGLQSAIAILLVLTSTFESLLIYIGVVLSLFSSLTVLALLRLRKTRPQAERPYKAWGYPFTPLFFIGGNLWIIFYFFKNNFLTLLWSAVTIAAGLLFYQLFAFRSRTRQGPPGETK